jgi:ubiquinone/menaquinone biosynthesis C-methylase UbiE
LQPFDDHYHKKQDIISKYNSTSIFYDNRYAEIQKEKYDYFLKYVQIHSKMILDAGSGTGLLITHLLNLVKSSRLERFLYVGVDISLNMLMVAKSRISEINESKNFELILADLENLPIRSDIFSCVFSITSLQNLYDLRKGVKEIIRTSKSDSALNLSILKKKNDKNKLISILEPYCHVQEFEDKEDIEDFLIKGQIIKK